MILFIFDNKYSDKKRVDLVLRECYGVGKTHSFRVFAKMGFNKKTKLQDLRRKPAFYVGSTIVSLVQKLFRLQVELTCRHFLGLRMKVIRNNQTYRSLRHFFKLPTRGQRTKNNAQTQKRKRPNWRRVPIAGKKSK
jgi:small subunit ribosomal protein S13